MFTKARVFFMLVETPLHAGSGNDLGVVDLPIQRERYTGFPKIEASGLKGSIREAFERLPGDELRMEALAKKFPKIKEEPQRYRQALNLVFGPETGDLHAGALGFTDARLLLFPVRSARGVFAWVSCPAVLSRLRRELELAGVSPPPVPEAGTMPEGSDLLLKDNKVVLEEYTFTVRTDPGTTQLARWLVSYALPRDNVFSYWQEKMTKSLVVLPDDDFRDFTSLATEVVTRIRIDPDTATVQSGALFNEEYLPQESLLYSLALASPIFGAEGRDIFAGVKEKEEDAVLALWETGMPAVLQVGGNATLGKGLVRIWLGGR